MPYISEDSTDHPVVLSFPQGHNQEAEPLYRCAMAITEATRGKGHPAYSVDLTNLAALLKKQVTPRPPVGRNCALYIPAAMQVVGQDSRGDFIWFIWRILPQGKYGEA